jgi:hypothetical protein
MNAERFGFLDTTPRIYPLREWQIAGSLSMNIPLMLFALLASSLKAAN